MKVNRCDVQMSLMEIGVPMRLNGYRYLVDVVLMSFEPDMKMSKHLNSYVYPTLSKRYGVSEGSIERAIRYAIKVTIGQMPMSKFCTLFSYGTKSVSISTFISSILRYIDVHCVEDPLASCIHNVKTISGRIDKYSDPETVKMYDAVRRELNDLKARAVHINDACVTIMNRIDLEEGSLDD